MHPKAKARGSKKGNGKGKAKRKGMGDGPEPVWPIEARARMVDMPLKARTWARAEIGPPRSLEERHSELGLRDEHGRSR